MAIPILGCLLASPGFAGEATRTVTGTGPDRFQAGILIAAGEGLSATGAEALEAGLARTPGDLAARAQLIGYYDSNGRDSLENRIALVNHVLWVIRNAPESGMCADHRFRLYKWKYTDKAVADARTAWAEALKSHPLSTTVLDHAASFFTIDDRALTEEYYVRAERLDPRNPHWAEQLGSFHLLGIERDPDPVRRERGIKASDAFDRAVRLTPEVPDRLSLLDGAAYAAWLAGRDKAAGGYARTLLENTPPDWWNRTRAVCAGHTILGLVALRAGDRKAAVEHLAKSVDLGRTGKESLFNPPLELAEELLAAGERKAVLDYLAALSPYVNQKDKVAEWAQLVREGATIRFREMLF